MNLTDEQKRIQAELRPAIQRLVKKVDDHEALIITGFIYGGTNKKEDGGEPFLLRFGNTTNTGMELIHIHYTLAVMAAQLQGTNHADVDDLRETQPATPSEAIADKMALALMAVPEEFIPDDVTTLLKNYFKTRKES